MTPISPFKSIENKHDLYIDGDCIIKLSKSSRKLAMEIINFKKKKRKTRTNNRNEMKMQKFVIFVKKNLKMNILKLKNCKDRDHFHYPGKYGIAAHSICNLKYIAPKEIPIVFYNGSNYDIILS